MNSGNQQIGWSQEAILLYKISRELERLAGITANISGGGGGGTGTVGPGTTNKIAKFINGSTVDDSSITDTGAVVTIGAALTVTGALTAPGYSISGGTPEQLLAANGSVVTAGTNITISGGVISANLSTPAIQSANNGLTKTGTNVALGGPLVANASIDTSGFSVVLTSSSNNYLLNMLGNSATTPTLKAQNDAGGAVEFQGAGSAAVVKCTGIGNALGHTINTQDGVPLTIVATAISDNSSVRNLVSLTRGSATTPGNGIGMSVEMLIQTTAGPAVASRLTARWLNATASVRSSEVQLTTVNSGTTNSVFVFGNTGLITLPTANNTIITSEPTGKVLITREWFTSNVPAPATVFTPTNDGLVPTPNSAPSGRVLSDDSTWISADLIASRGQTGFFTWKYNSNITMTPPGPGNGDFRANTNSASTTTMLYLSETTSGTLIDMGLIFSNIIGNWTLYIQQRTDSTKYAQFTINGALTDTGTAWLIPVQYVKTGPGGEIVSGQECYFIFINQNSTAQSVPQARTLTINGLTQDLSADRSWDTASRVTVVPYAVNIGFDLATTDIVRCNAVTGPVTLVNPTGTNVDGRAIIFAFYNTTGVAQTLTFNNAYVRGNVTALPTSIPNTTNSIAWKVQFRYSALSGKYELDRIS